MQHSYQLAVKSIKGSSHEVSGLPCQDFSAFAEVSGHTIIAVADGVGSAKYAAEGAKLAVRQIIKRVQRHLKSGKVIDKEFLQSAFSDTAKYIFRVSSKVGQTAASFSTTLQIVIIGEKQALIAGVGDGAIIYSAADQEFQLFVTDEDSSLYANQTSTIFNELAVGVLELKGPLSFALLCTDGVRSVLVNEQAKTAHKPAFDYISSRLNGGINALPLITEILTHPALLERVDDDLTIGLYFSPQQTEVI